MSTIKTNTLSTLDGSYSVPSETLARAACRAWCNFNGTGTVAIRASFNVSSITDLGVGQYTVNFTDSMPDADYAMAGSAYNNGNNVPVVGNGRSNNTATQAYVNCGPKDSVGEADYSVVSVAIFR